MGSTPIPGTKAEIERCRRNLMVPLVAMQFSDDVVWTQFDFVFAGVLLFSAGLTYELIAKKTSNVASRTAVGVAVAAAPLLVWINGAVGIIGD